MEQLQETLALCMAQQAETLAALRDLTETLAGFTNSFTTRHLRIIDDDGHTVAQIDNINGRGVLTLADGGEIITIGSP